MAEELIWTQETLTVGGPANQTTAQTFKKHGAAKTFDAGDATNEDLDKS